MTLIKQQRIQCPHIEFYYEYCTFQSPDLSGQTENQEKSELKWKIRDLHTYYEHYHVTK